MRLGEKAASCGVPDMLVLAVVFAVRRLATIRIIGSVGALLGTL